MFKPADHLPAHRRQLTRAMALAGLLPLAALAGITTPEPPEAVKAPAGTYQVRCWQQGRLLFEENQVSLPADSARYGIKMNGTDRNGKPIYVADTANATCLIRSVEDERAWPR